MGQNMRASDYELCEQLLAFVAYGPNGSVSRTLVTRTYDALATIVPFKDRVARGQILAQKYAGLVSACFDFILADETFRQDTHTWFGYELDGFLDAKHRIENSSSQSRM